MFRNFSDMYIVYASMNHQIFVEMIRGKLMKVRID
jgi:hypothetical protein